MGTNPTSEGFAADDFLERLLAIPNYADSAGGNSLGSDERLGSTASSTVSSSQLSSGAGGGGDGGAVGFVGGGPALGASFPLDLSLASPESGFRFGNDVLVNGGGSSVNCDGQFVSLNNLFPTFGHMPPHSAQPAEPNMHQVFHGQTTTGTPGSVQNPPSIRPKVRARRGQATDPHSIAERLRRERITERVKALQELVPSCNKTDRAAMLDEILDYVKFLRLQVKVLSMSRLGGAGAVAQLVADNPASSALGDATEAGSNDQPWEKWANDGTEQEVAKLMEKDVGAAMQFLQSKALCIMPVSLAAAIFSSQVDPSSNHSTKSEPNNT
ncbi:hypothetical protein V2J09_014256 [Rumex salicifolius]